MRLGGAAELSTVMFAGSGSGSFGDRSLSHHTFTLSHIPRPRQGAPALIPALATGLSMWATATAH